MANNAISKRQFYGSMSWIINPLLKIGHTLFENEVTFKLRINKEYKNFVATNGSLGRPTYEWNNDQVENSFLLTANDSTVCVGETVILSVNIKPSYPPGTVHCSGTPTAVVDVTNPTTGKTWMDRNLGASQVATSSTDAAAYGDLYQWGRGADGHQCRNSGTTTTLSSTDQPGNSNFILAPNAPYDWRSTQNDNLWQGVNGINNPCPSGYKIPTYAELDSELSSWINNNAYGAFNSPLKFTQAGYRSSSLLD
jgi:hypothetical protein